jgi:hypothetical protein
VTNENDQSPFAATPAEKRKMYEQHLAHAETAIAEGKEHIAKQRAVIARLQADGHDISQATALLETFLTTQRAHEEHRATIMKELEDINSGPG